MIAQLGRIQRAGYVMNGDQEMADLLGRDFADRGYAAANRRGAEQLVERSKTRYVMAAQVALLWIYAGQTDHALDWIEPSYGAHESVMVYANIQPDFDALRDQPRFQAIVRRMKLP